MQSILPIVIMAIYLAIVIYLISMLGRLVRAIERIYCSPLRNGAKYGRIS
jgi:hypothetical protein